MNEKKLNRVEFARKFFKDRNNKQWQVRQYQKKSLNSRTRRKVLRCGRDVGKTSEIEITALHAAIYQKNKELLIAAPRENHLLPLMERIIGRIPLIYPNKKDVKIQRSPGYRIVFPSGTTLWGRIAGNRGVNFQGMHADFIWVDEAQEFSDAAWRELLPAIKGKGKLWIYGVPNGVRNRFYQYTGMDMFTQFHWPTTLNPEFSEEKQAEFAALYGGENSPDYIHLILGEHGSPLQSVFDFDIFLDCKKQVDTYQVYSITARDLPLHHLEDLLPLPHTTLPVYLGADLGYASDPTEIVAWHISENTMIPVFRIHLEQLPYNLQLEVFEYLRTRLNVSGVGIDLGGSGLSVMHQLIARDPKWEELVCGINFGSWVTVSYSIDKANKEPAKSFMTMLLVRRLQNRQITMPVSDDKREEQYVNHTYQINEQGRVVYSKGNDHIIDADRCAVYCYHLMNLEPGELEPDLGVVLHGQQSVNDLLPPL